LFPKNVDDKGTYVSLVDGIRTFVEFCLYNIKDLKRNLVQTFSKSVPEYEISTKKRGWFNLHLNLNYGGMVTSWLLRPSSD